MEIKELRKLKERTENELTNAINEKLKEFYIETGCKPNGVHFDFNDSANLIAGEVQNPIVFGMKMSFIL